MNKNTKDTLKFIITLEQYSKRTWRMCLSYVHEKGDNNGKNKTLNLDLNLKNPEEPIEKLYNIWKKINQTLEIMRQYLIL